MILFSLLSLSLLFLLLLLVHILPVLFLFQCYSNLIFANQFERCIAKIAIQKSGSKLFPGGIGASLVCVSGKRE